MATLEARVRTAEVEIARLKSAQENLLAHLAVAAREAGNAFQELVEELQEGKEWPEK